MIRKDAVMNHAAVPRDRISYIKLPLPRWEGIKGRVMGMVMTTTYMAFSKGQEQ